MPAARSGGAADAINAQLSGEIGPQGFLVGSGLIFGGLAWHSLSHWSYCFGFCFIIIGARCRYEYSDWSSKVSQQARRVLSQCAIHAIMETGS
jgi:hypothetical protein